MLTKCPECDLPVSDKAITCPHCGYPLRPSGPSRQSTSSKHKRLPNGFGQITKISGNLRNPYRAMITIGKTDTGKPIARLLKPQAYFKTYNEAYAALMEYNRNPYDLKDDMTVLQLYERWSIIYFAELKSDSSIRTITSAWSYCSSVYNMRVRDLRARHIKGCMEDGTIEYKGVTRHATPNTQSRIKSMFNIMLDYAVEYELVDKNYSRTFDLSNGLTNEIEKSRRGHLSFTDAEMETLKNHTDVPYVWLILFQCYSGFRPQELGLIETEKVDLEANIVVGGMKTDAGTDRKVPIHPYVLNYISENYHRAISENRKYLFEVKDGITHKDDTKLTYDKYKGRFEKVMKTLGLNPEHKPHDPRKQFVTMCKKYKVDDYAIKRIIGHRIDDVTEAVYTDRPDSWLVEEVKKIEA